MQVAGHAHHHVYEMSTLMGFLRGAPITEGQGSCRARAAHMVGDHPPTGVPAHRIQIQASSEEPHGGTLSCVCRLQSERRRQSEIGMPWRTKGLQAHLPLLFPALSLYPSPPGTSFFLCRVFTRLIRWSQFLIPAWSKQATIAFF